MWLILAVVELHRGRDLDRARQAASHRTAAGEDRQDPLGGSTLLIVSDADSGGTRVDPRTNQLTSWGLKVLIDVLADEVDSSARLLPVSAASAAATVSNAMRDLCQAAGINPRVGIEEIRAWRARQPFAHTMSIQHVALFLGTRSLDTACEIVGYQWRASA